MADRLARRIVWAPFSNWAFRAAASLFALNLALQKGGFSPPILQYYLNDLLCLPLVLTLTLFLQRSFTFRNPYHTFTRHQVGIAVLYYSVGFEAVLPQLMDRYTADLLDVLAYALGGLFFYLFINVAPEKGLP